MTIQERIKPLLLIILDGFGAAPASPDNPINHETMPFFFSLLQKYPWTTLHASGPAVGLPTGVRGNSSVGHFTIGAGAIYDQPLTTITRLIQENKLCSLPLLKKHFTDLAHSGKTLHLLGLISNGNVHNSLAFNQALIACAREYGIANIKVHAILDGRDVPQKSAATFLAHIDAPIVTIQGRLYAMDRNENTQRLAQAYAVLTEKQKPHFASWHEALDYYYAQGFTDETIPPTSLNAHAALAPGDGLIFSNIRAERSRELYNLLKQNKDLYFLITGVNYDDTDTQAICMLPRAHDTLTDYLEEHHIPLVTVAESEKYAHVTYFLHGGQEKKGKYETRIIIPSDSPTTFASEPAMKAREITATLIEELHKNAARFFIANYANADMVGHTGNIPALKKALAVLDEQLRTLYTAFVEKEKGIIFLTADHGNAEDKKNNSPTHSRNPAYFVFVSEPPWDKRMLSEMQGLADIKAIVLSSLLHNK